MNTQNDDSGAPADTRGLPFLNGQQKESLVMLIVINFAEEHRLLNTEQLEEARASLRAMFLHASGEETMLRKVIGILHVNRALNKTFSDMTRVLDAIRKSHRTLVERHAAFTQQVEAMNILPEENTQFIGPLLDFSNDFVRSVGEFDRLMTEYKDAMETESRTAHTFRLAQEARDRLRQRFDPGAATDSRQEQQVRENVIKTFNYAEAESGYQYARRTTKHLRRDIERVLADFHQLSQLAMNPDMRSATRIQGTPGQPERVDVYVTARQGIEKFPRLNPLVAVVQELLRLYQRSFGMFTLDFDKFNSALGPMIENTMDYFEAKVQDEDVRTKLKKLEEIEALIAYIEDVAPQLRDGLDQTYAKFSILISAHISRPASPWTSIAEALLHLKVAAEAELSTRLA